MLLLYYFIFKDVHHFCVDSKSIEEIFDENFLNYQHNDVPENFDLNNYNFCLTNDSIDLLKLMKARRTHKPWLTRRFPETVKEYKKIFYDYLELCKKFNIIPIVTMFPVTHIYREFFSKQVFDEALYIIREAQKIYKFHFLNKYDFDEGLELKDFFDVNHLNSSGARKISTFINNYIMELEHNSNFK